MSRKLILALFRIGKADTTSANSVCIRIHMDIGRNDAEKEQSYVLKDKGEQVKLYSDVNKHKKTQFIHSNR
jgi:hypothetical protein